MKTTQITNINTTLILTFLSSQNILQKNKILQYLYQILLVFSGVLLLSIASHIKIPFYPVPLTMQTFAVLVIGMGYGMTLGGTTIATYLAFGFLGFPVFANGAGVAYIIGPTGGYLMGFFFATIIVGFLAECGMSKKWFLTASTMIFGNIVIYIFGLLHLSNVLSLSLSKTMEVGLYPFLLGDSLKLILASVLMPFLWNLVKKFNDS